MYLVGAGVLCMVLSYLSEKFYRYLKRALLFLAVLLALVAGYELVSGKSILSLPSRIDQKLDESPSQTESGRRYYRSYEEQMGGNSPK